MDKNLTFAITHGRTGTAFVTELFGLFEDTRAEHEPEPSLAHHFPQIKNDPREAVEFLKIKLDAISKISQKNYVETGNVFGKGYFIPLVRAFDIYPNLLLLARDFREIAKSLHKRGSIPARSPNGELFSCHPEQPGALPVFKHEQLTDYQMCYWAVLDAFSRQLQAEGIYLTRRLNNYAWVTAQDFHEFDTLKKCGELFGLSFADEAVAKAKHKEMIGKTYNANPEREVEDIKEIDKQEAIVIDRVAYYNMLFAEHVLKTDFVAVDTLAKFS